MCFQFVAYLSKMDGCGRRRKVNRYVSENFMGKTDEGMKRSLCKGRTYHTLTLFCDDEHALECGLEFLVNILHLLLKCTVFFIWKGENFLVLLVEIFQFLL